MSDDNKMCQFDERVNLILLVMFIVVVVVLTIKGCSSTLTNYNCSKRNHSRSTIDEAIVKDSVYDDKTLSIRDTL